MAGKALAQLEPEMKVCDRQPTFAFVEEAKRIIQAGHPLDVLPLSVPEVYSRYLEQVNPAEPSLPNFMVPADRVFVR